MFCERVLYVSHASSPQLFSVSPFDDQIIAGALRWIFGTIVYLVPGVIITIQLLSPIDPEQRGHARVTLHGIPYQKLIKGEHRAPMVLL